MCIKPLCYPPCTRTRNSLSSSPAGLLAKQLYLPVSSNWVHKSVTKHENVGIRDPNVFTGKTNWLNLNLMYCMRHGILLQKSPVTDLCWGCTEHLSTLQEAQTVCLWERASILQPGQSGWRDTRGLTMKLQDIINYNRYFCCYTRALYVRRVWQRQETQFHFLSMN